MILAAFILAAAGTAPAQTASPAMARSPSALAPATVPPDMMGIVIRDPWFDFDTNPAFPGQPNKTFQDRMGAALAQMGARWVRLDFRIAAPLDAQLPPDFIEREIAKNDYFINEVAPRHGFKVLGLLSFDLIQGTDAHVLNTGPFTETSIYGGGVNRYMDEWLTRALMIADRYGERVAAYQVLNEQNRLPRYLPDGPTGDGIDPVIVARMVTKLYRFCRGIPPLPRPAPYRCAHAEIITGGLHPRGTTDGKSDQTILTDADYLKRMYASRPFQDFREANGRWPVDGIGYHPYPEEIRLSPNDALVDRGLNRMRAALAEAGDPNVPFWITEIGYNVGFDADGPRGPIPPQTEAGQAEFLRDIYVVAGGARRCGTHLLVQVRRFSASGRTERAALGAGAHSVSCAAARRELPWRSVLRRRWRTGTVASRLSGLPRACRVAGVPAAFPDHGAVRGGWI